MIFSEVKAGGIFLTRPYLLSKMLPCILVFILVLLIPHASKAFEWEHYGILRRTVWTPVFNYGDSLIEFTKDWWAFAVTDTFGNNFRPVIFPRDTTARRCFVYRGDGWFDMVVNRYVERIDNPAWPYLYRLNVNDTGFVEERSREIELQDYCRVFDAEPVINGGYMLFYCYGGRHLWYRVCRVTEDGDTLWTRVIMEIDQDDPFRTWTRLNGIIPSSRNPAHFYIFGKKRHESPYRMTAYISLIDTSGEILWTREHYLSGIVVDNIVSMEAFDDGTYALIGTRNSSELLYMHLSEDGDSLNAFQYGRLGISADYYMRTLVIGGERLLIYTQFDHIEWDRKCAGLLYINEEGDSLDGYFFHPDTVRDSNGYLLERPNGKVMLWVKGRSCNILYTFYPDGRPPENGVPPFDESQMPERVMLNPAFPNPFNSEVRISYALNAELKSDVSVFNLRGQKIESLFHGQQSAGLYDLTWNAKDLGSGVYFIRLTTPELIRTQKVTLIR